MGAKETEANMEDIHNGLMQRASRQTTTTPAGVGLLREKERWFTMVGPRGKEHTVCVCVCVVWILTGEFVREPVLGRVVLGLSLQVGCLVLGAHVV